MPDPLHTPELREMLKSGDFSGLDGFFESKHPVEVADLLLDFGPDEAWQILKHADLSLRAEIFTNLDEELQVEMIGELQREDIARLFTELPPDDRADLFRRLPEENQQRVLPALAQAEREDIRRLAAYKEGTAGAVMTSDYASLSPELTVGGALERLREIAPNKETIYSAYVVDEKRRLIGYVSLKDLILARRDARIGDIMHEDVIFARVEEDQEAAARKIQKYDLIALPVVNGGDALVGIVTHDDAIDIITQEQTEDLEKLMAIAGTHQPHMYIRTSIWSHFKNRAIWLIALAALGLVSGLIVQCFEGLLLQFTILAAFMPMLADTGGNTGSQSGTLVVRALALGEVTVRDVFRIVSKELGVGVLLGLLLAVIAFGRVAFFGGLSGSTEYSPGLLGFAIALALGLQVATSTVIGALLPILAATLKKDPALVASPALTTVVDITGLLIYFLTVKIVLGI